MDDRAGGGAFRVHDARKAGKSRRWIDGRQFDRPFHGLRAPHEPPPPANAFEQSRLHMRRAALHWSLHMSRAEYFSHVTAAVIWDLPLPGWVVLEPRRGGASGAATGLRRVRRARRFRRLRGPGLPRTADRDRVRGGSARIDPAQWHRDIEKHERLADLGWRVVRVTREQLFADPSNFVARVRRLHGTRR